MDELIRDRSTMMLEQANRKVYGLLKDGINVSGRTAIPRMREGKRLST